MAYIKPVLTRLINQAKKMPARSLAQMATEPSAVRFGTAKSKKSILETVMDTLKTLLTSVQSGIETLLNTVSNWGFIKKLNDWITAKPITVNPSKPIKAPTPPVKPAVAPSAPPKPVEAKTAVPTPPPTPKPVPEPPPAQAPPPPKPTQVQTPAPAKAMPTSSPQPVASPPANPELIAEPPKPPASKPAPGTSEVIPPPKAELSELSLEQLQEKWLSNERKAVQFKEQKRLLKENREHLIQKLRSVEDELKLRQAKLKNLQQQKPSTFFEFSPTKRHQLQVAHANRKISQEGKICREMEKCWETLRRKQNETALAIRQARHRQHKAEYKKVLIGQWKNTRTELHKLHQP